MPDSSGWMGLSTALEGLREELESVWEQSRDRPVSIVVDQVTLTLEAVARREAEGSGKIRWWLVEAGGGVTAGAERTQTLVLTLTPRLRDEEGRISPFAYKE